jgi:hypothetical protein
VHRIFILVLAAALFSFTPATAVEIGTPDPTPAPKVSCGGLPCSLLAGKYFAFAGFDSESFAELPNLGQFCMPPFKGNFDYCRIPGKNAIPSNNLNKVILKNGWVELSYPVKYDLSRNPAVIFPPEFLGLKVTLQGANAQFGTYPQPNFTFSSDRKTVYIKAHTVSSPPPSADGVILQIKAPSVGEITVTGFLEVGENTYSTSPLEIGKILVVSKYDEFVFSTDKKTGQPIATKDIKKYSICTKGKLGKKVLQKNLASSICPTGFKVKT